MSTLPLILSILLAVTLVGDAALSVKPVKFIEGCLTGVGFPRDWWWALVFIKLLAAGGIVVGLVAENSSFVTAATAGVCAYFVAAAIAHVKAKFINATFWVNCLGMLVFSTVTLVLVAAS